MRKLGLIALMLWSCADGAALTLYSDALQNGYGDSSWAQAADYSLANTTPTYGGSSHSIKFVARNWGGLQFVAGGTEFNVADYQSLTFQVNGGSAGGQKLQLFVCDNYDTLPSDTYPLESLMTGGSIPKNAWATVTLDFDAVQMTYGTFNCLVIMDADGNNDAAGQPAVYIDQIVFNPRTVAIANGGTVNVGVDVNANRHPIDTRVFGVAYGDATRNGQVGYSVRRWGGNSTSRYNWQVDFHNTGSDYYYENIPDCQGTCTGTPPIGNSADAFIAEAQAGGALPLITIPTIGWTPRSDSSKTHPFTVGFAVSKYGAQQSVDQYDTNAGNGNHTNGSPITGNDPADTSVAAPPSFEQGWVAHLQSTFGTAATTGVKLYTLDNEVMLWNSTHRDVHPAGPTYDEIWSKTQSYAGAIKVQEPDALVTGPVTWGYCDLFTSADDASRGNCLSGTDRSAHGGLPFVGWYLQQVCANPLSGGKHLVDFLDLHYYPQGQNVALNGSDSSTTAGLRLRSLKELYDTTWVSESWLGTLGDFDSNHYDKPGLIPRVRAWINAYCPGTKLAITEYNWGNDGTTSGAVAQAEALAIFARDGVDMATRWVAPGVNTKAERGFQIFLNYDGAGAKVQGYSAAATTSNVDQVGAYVFHDVGQRTMVLLTNKDTLSHDVTVTFNAAPNGTWKLYGFDGVSGMHQINTGSISSTALTLNALPPMSASLLVTPDIDQIFKNGFQ
jgi:hypothetical protein